TRPKMQWLVEITGVNSDETARRGVGLTRFECGAGWNSYICAHAAIGFHFHKQRERKRESLDVSNGFADPRRPESHNRNTATITAFYHRSHNVGPRKRPGKLQNVIFSPVITRSVKRPHVVRPTLYLMRVEAMPLLDSSINLEF